LSLLTAPPSTKTIGRLLSYPASMTQGTAAGDGLGEHPGGRRRAKGVNVIGRKISLLAQWSGKASATILFFAVAIAPLPYGSAEDSAIAFWSIVLGLGLITVPVRQLRKPHFVLLGCAAVVVAAYGVVLHEQLSTHPWFSVAVPHPLWKEASEALGTPLEPSVSIARNEPFFALGSPLVCMLALVCGFLVGTDRSYARTILWIIAGSGVVYAVYGIADHLLDPTRILLRDKPAYLANVTGTFINRNTAAVYFGSCAIVCLMLLSDRLRRKLPRDPIVWKRLPNKLLSNTPRDIVALFAMLFVCLAAMFMTGSRGGVILSLMALIVAFTVYFRRDLPRRTGIVTAVLGGGAVVLVLLQFMGGEVNARFAEQGAADEGRLATWRATLRMIADHPWFGTGQGTFVWSYPAYRSAEISMVGVWDRAHNTLLELAADMGVPLAALVTLGWILIFAVLVHGVRVRRRDLLIPASALAVAMLAVLHSLVDFSLQIPGYAIPALALVGAGLAQSFATDKSWQQTEGMDSQAHSHSLALPPTS
jgi:O-Antigen ligase